KPDVVTMDLDMPDLDGLGTVETIMAAQPTPILVVTGKPRFRGLDGHFEALMRGAVDLMCKPSSVDPSAPDVIRLAERFRGGARMPVTPTRRNGGRTRQQHTTAPLSPIATARMLGGTPAIVAIGASTGGPGALRTVLAGLGANLPVPVV